MPKGIYKRGKPHRLAPFVIKIRQMYDNGVKIQQIADYFECSYSAIEAIVKGINYYVIKN